jgi:hypothetical protein
MLEYSGECSAYARTIDSLTGGIKVVKELKRGQCVLLAISLASKALSQQANPSGRSPGQDDREKIRSQFVQAFSNIRSQGNDVPLLTGIDVTLGSTTAEKVTAIVSAKCNYDYVVDLGPHGAFRCNKSSSVKLNVEADIHNQGSGWEIGNNLVLKESTLLGGIIDSVTPSVRLKRPSGGHPQDREGVLKMLPSYFAGERMNAPVAPRKVIAVVIGTYASLAVVEVSGQRHFVVVHPYGLKHRGLRWEQYGRLRRHNDPACVSGSYRSFRAARLQSCRGLNFEWRIVGGSTNQRSSEGVQSPTWRPSHHSCQTIMRLANNNAHVYAVDRAAEIAVGVGSTMCPSRSVLSILRNLEVQCLNHFKVPAVLGHQREALFDRSGSNERIENVQAVRFCVQLQEFIRPRAGGTPERNDNVCRQKRVDIGEVSFIPCANDEFQRRDLRDRPSLW